MKECSSLSLAVMKDTLIMFTHSKRVLYVHEFYLVISLVDFTVSLQHAGANDTQVFQILQFRGEVCSPA